MLKQHCIKVVPTFCKVVSTLCTVVSTSDTDVVSALCKVENLTSDFVSFSTLDQRHFNVDPQRWSDVEMLAKKHETQPTIQRRMNLVSTLWINVEITLIRRWKWNKIQRYFQNPTFLKSNLIINIILTPQRYWNYIETNRAIEYGSVNRWIFSFFLIRQYFLQYVTNSTTSSCTCCNTHVAIRNNKGYIHGNLKECNFKTSKIPWN